MTITKNLLLLRRLKVNLPNVGENNLQMAASCQRELMVYGYMLSQEAFNMVKSADAAEIEKFHNELVVYLKEMTGGNRSYTSLYKNFPRDIMSMSDSELFVGQILHYYGVKDFGIIGKAPEQEFSHPNYKEIYPCDEDYFLNIFTSLLSVGNSLTPEDTETIKWFINSKVELRYPATIPFKENLAVVVSLCPDFRVRDVTDVLRIALAMSGGDPLLPAIPKKLKKQGKKWADNVAERAKHKFKLTDAQKIQVMTLLENTNLDIRDMQQGSRYGRWIRLFEVLAIQNHRTQFPLSATVAHTLRNQKRKGKPTGFDKVITWHSRVQSAFKENFEAGVNVLAERPGEFFRKLDFLVRKNPKKLDIIFKALIKNADKTSSKVLFEVFCHFTGRDVPITNRSIFIKGAKSKTALPDLPALPKEVISTIQEFILNLLQTKYSSLPQLGKCYIDEELKKIPLPTNMRSMSESLVPIIRGQRIPVGTGKKVLRPFVHWYDERGNEDIDMHGYLLGKTVMQFGYNGSHVADYGCYSGDVRNRKGSCAEYVDININAAVKAGFKYFLVVIHNFQDRPFSSLKECYVGTQERDNAEQNSSWKPDSVTTGMKLTSSAKYALTGVYDLETREYIHLDLDWNLASAACNSGNANELFKTIQEYIVEPKFSVYDLVKLHVNARGQSVLQEDADTFFLVDDYKFSYDKTLELIG